MKIEIDLDKDIMAWFKEQADKPFLSEVGKENQMKKLMSHALGEYVDIHIDRRNNTINYRI